MVEILLQVCMLSLKGGVRASVRVYEREIERWADGGQQIQHLQEDTDLSM